MFRFLLDRRQLRRLLARAERARRDKDSALTAFVTGAPASPVIVPFSPWSWRNDGQPDGGRLIDLITACEQLEAEVAAVRARLGRGPAS